MNTFPFFFKILVLIFVKTRLVESQSRAFYTFGDSLIDPGNNNYINTILKANFAPYGKDFDNQISTGRFCNGRLVPDFIALYMGYNEYVKPYLDPSLKPEDLVRAVSFGSSGAGFDPTTANILNIIPVLTQLNYLRECKNKLKLAIGANETEEVFKNAIFYVCIGSNDFGTNYFNPVTPSRRTMYTVPEYTNFLLPLTRQFIQGLWEEGARTVVFAGLPPLGCLPVVITFESQNIKNSVVQRDCVEYINSVSQDFNGLIQNELRILQSTLDGLKFYYIDQYWPIINITSNPRNYGFNEVTKGCCGTGYTEIAPLCNPKTSVCIDAHEYAYFDSAHPSEKTYNVIFEANRHVIDDILR